MKAIIAALALSFCSLAYSSSDDIAEPVPHPLHLPPIKSVKIEENAAMAEGNWGPGTTKENCKKFKLSGKTVADFLKRTNQISNEDYSEVLDVSPCYATGTVTFNNGQTAWWYIQAFRAGKLHMRGKNSEPTYLLYCAKCEKMRPFSLW